MIKKKIRVMGFGTFDGLHPGHLNYLQQLRTLGDEVFVVVARDKNVEKIKGKLPHYTEVQRSKALEKIGLADRVILGDEKNFYECVVNHKPDIIGLGYDQQADIQYLQKHFPDIRIVRLKAFEPKKHKSSLINSKR